MLNVGAVVIVVWPVGIVVVSVYFIVWTVDRYYGVDCCYYTYSVDYWYYSDD